MTEARVEKAYADRVGAKAYLRRAEAFLADAAVAGLGAASQAVLVHNAAISACDASSKRSVYA